MMNKPKGGSRVELTVSERWWSKSIRKTLAFAILPLIFIGCGAEAEKVEFQSFQGPTMGTAYAITVETSGKVEFLKSDVDSLLVILNDQLSTYIPESTISRFNQSDTGIYVRTSLEPFFIENLLISKDVYRRTNGLFDPTVMPLVNYWGFGYQGHEAPGSIDTAKVDSLLKYVGYDKISMEVGQESFIGKPERDIKLDFSAIAKGYGVDIVAGYLEDMGIDNYLVDIGGELCVKGSGRRGQGWVLGINTPDPTEAGNSISERFMLTGGCVATSGNYRNFRMVEGKAMGHTLDPRTGFPEKNNMLSVTIWAETSAMADAFATACMVAGYPAARLLTEENEGLEAYFIYINDEGEVVHSWTEGFEPFLMD